MLTEYVAPHMQLGSQHGGMVEWVNDGGPFSHVVAIFWPWPSPLLKFFVSLSFINLVVLFFLTLNH